MTMKSVGCFQYTIPAYKLTSLFPAEYRDEWANLVNSVEDSACESLIDFTSKHYPESYPIPGFYMLGDEDDSEDLDKGVPYALFDITELYHITIKDEARKMCDELDDEPKPSTYCVWC